MVPTSSTSLPRPLSSLSTHPRASSRVQAHPPNTFQKCAVCWLALVGPWRCVMVRPVAAGCGVGPWRCVMAHPLVARDSRGFEPRSQGKSMALDERGMWHGDVTYSQRHAAPHPMLRVARYASSMTRFDVCFVRCVMHSLRNGCWACEHLNCGV